MDVDIPNEALAAKPSHRWWTHPLSIVMLAAIVLLALALAQAGRQAIVLRRELKSLRRVAGHLDIKDPNKIYAVRIPTDDPYEWAWRVYLPPGPELHLHEWKGRMPAEGLPHDPDWRTLRGTDYQGTIGSINPGEITIRVLLERQPSGEWMVTTWEGRNRGTGRFGYRTDWLAGRSWSELSDVPIGEQREFPAEGALTLLRLRNTLAAPETHSPGVTDTIFVFIADTKTKPP
jgi:hypothetical protein